MKAEIYYWKDIERMIELSYREEKEYPDEKTIEEDWVKLPISFDMGEDEDVDAELDKIFAELNQENNPMGTPEMQQWIRDNGLKHTSMSVGDIIKNKKGLYICEDLGWYKLQ